MAIHYCGRSCMLSAYEAEELEISQGTHRAVFSSICRVADAEKANAVRETTGSVNTGDLGEGSNEI